MIYDNFGGIRYPLKQNLALQFCRNRNKNVSILTEAHINLDQIHHIRNNWLGVIFLYPGDSHTNGLLFLLHLGLEDVSEVDNDWKGRFVSFKFTFFNGRVLCVYFLDIASEFNRRGRSSDTRYTMDKVHTDIKMARNGKVNYIMLCVTDHYNAIFIDRFPWKTKIGKDSWYINNSILCKSELSLTTGFSLLLKTENATTLQQVTGGKH